MKNILNTLRNNPVYQQATQTVNSIGYDLGGSKRVTTIKHPIMTNISDQVEAEPPLHIDAVSGANEPDSATHRYQLRLRLATAADLPAVAELEGIGYNGYMAWELEDFVRDWQTNPYAVYLVLENVSESALIQDDATKEEVKPPIVGMITGRFLVKKAHISHLIIHPDFQGHGLGDYLLTQWLILAKRLKVRQASLEVRESNFPAQQLYYKHGFTLASKKENYYYNNHETAYYLIRSLN